MPEKLAPDICVIGAGAAGLSAAAAPALFGVPTVLIEQGNMGGECLNDGCVPSKALLAAARRADHMRGDAFGVRASDVQVDFAKVQAHVQDVIASIAPVDAAERFRALGVRVIQGYARFTDRRTVTVGDAYAVRARRFVVATGARAAVPPSQCCSPRPPSICTCTWPRSPAPASAARTRSQPRVPSASE